MTSGTPGTPPKAVSPGRFHRLYIRVCYRGFSNWPGQSKGRSFASVWKQYSEKCSILLHLHEHIRHPLHSGFGGVGVAKGGKADVALSTGAEACAGGGGHVGPVQHLVEEVPGAHAVGGLQPDIGGVHPAEAGQAGGGEALPDDPGVFPVVVDIGHDLGPALGGVDGGGPRWTT